MRNRMKLGLAVAAIAAGLITSSAKAAITNGEFGTGDLTGYTPMGDVSVQGSDFNPPEPAATDTGNIGFLTTISGPPQAAYSQSYATSNIASADTSAGLAAGTLEGKNATSVSLLSQTFTATAGDVLTFNYNFLTNENFTTSSPNNGNPDASFVAIKGPVGNATYIQLAGVNDATTFPGATAQEAGIYNFLGSGTGRETGNLSYTSSPLLVGTYTVTFGVYNSVNTLNDSGLLVDNIAEGPAVSVPLPAGVFLAPLGMAVAARASRRFRKQKA